MDQESQHTQASTDAEEAVSECREWHEEGLPLLCYVKEREEKALSPLHFGPKEYAEASKATSVSADRIPLVFNRLVTDKLLQATDNPFGTGAGTRFAGVHITPTGLRFIAAAVPYGST